MDTLEVTKRTKDAVRIWSNKPNAVVLLDDKLDKFRTGAREPLRRRVNEQFSPLDGDFPISPVDWQALNAKTVREVRDDAKSRTN